jgi:hypothetical protein
LTLLLLSKGFEVNYLSTSKKKLLMQPSYKGFYWNPQNMEIDMAVLEEVQVIVHLAGASIAKRWTKSYKKEILESRTKSAQLLYKTLKEQPNKVEYFISASAIGLYRDDLNFHHKEDSPLIDNGFLSAVVQQWEAGIDEFRSLGINVCKLRTGLVLSEKGGALPQMIRPFKFGLGARIGSGKQVQSWIHITDLIDMYFFAIENRLQGAYNAVAPNPVTNTELTKAIARQLQRPLIMPNVPKFLVKAILGEMHQLLFLSQKVSCDKMTQAGFKYNYPNLDAALADILK